MIKNTAVRKFYTDKQIRDINYIIGNNLRIARCNAGYSQREVMTIMYGNRQDRSRISEIENGKVSINLYQFLIFLDLYGQSSDYILGRSCEPVNDILAANINHVMLNARKYFEPMIESMTESVIEHIKKIDKDEHVNLLALCDDLCRYTIENNKHLQQIEPQLHEKLIRLNEQMRKIHISEAQRMQQMYAQMDSIRERHDQEDHHLLMKDLDKPFQLPLPLPKPTQEYLGG